MHCSIVEKRGSIWATDPDCQSELIKDSKPVFVATLQVFFCLSLQSSREGRLAEINQTSVFISPYETNHVLKFSSMSGPGQNESCEALNEQVFRGNTQALSRRRFPCFTELA